MVLLFLLLLVPTATPATVVLQSPMAPGVVAAIRGGRDIHIECRLPQGDAAKAVLTRYLDDPKQWSIYKGRMVVMIPYAKLNPTAKRQVLETLFPKDYVDARGWWHTVAVRGDVGLESWWAISEWLTGLGTNYKQLMAVPENQPLGSKLNTGMKLLVPHDFLIEAMRVPTPGHEKIALKPLDPKEDPVIVEVAKAPVPDSKPVANHGLPEEALDKGLKMLSGQDEPLVGYKLKQGESVYSDVIMRFTSYRDPQDVKAACDEVLRLSNVADARKLKAGHTLKLPLAMLSDQYHPEGTEQRLAYVIVRDEARKLQARQEQTKDLDGVVIVLDPGHGGRDRGTAHTATALYEDELNYDIACRIKALLEKDTRARIHMTQKDPSIGYAIQNSTRFSHDQDEHVLTTPPYVTDDARVAANLRWYLANDIYRNELKRGTADDKILFASIHIDALPSQMRGTMVYVPGARYRKTETDPISAQIYRRFNEYNNQPRSKVTTDMLRRDEALSRNFANTLIHSIAHNDPPIKVHGSGDEAIRNVIHKTRNTQYVPAVLRNNLIPTKVLVEVANMDNSTDRQRIADPQWRQWYAEAFVTAVKRHFKS